jgi:hypothetical protein
LSYRPSELINFSQTLIDARLFNPSTAKGTPLKRKGKRMFNPIYIGIDVSHRNADVGVIDASGSFLLPVYSLK